MAHYMTNAATTSQMRSQSVEPSIAVGKWDFISMMIPGVSTVSFVVFLIFRAIAACLSDSVIRKSPFWTYIKSGGGTSIAFRVLLAIPVVGSIAVVVAICSHQIKLRMKASQEAAQIQNQPISKWTCRVEADGTVPETHEKAFIAGRNYDRRGLVPLSKISWEVPFPDYSPVEHTDRVVVENDRTQKPGGWADPTAYEWLKEGGEIHTYGNREIERDENGLPRNPVGRTGMTGRGLLGKWGPNHAADPIITRVNPLTGNLEMLAIQRRDTREWAIPGGMVNPGEKCSATAKRELEEEAGVVVDFERAPIIYKGYVDDPRNTDNAWMETVAVHVHLTPEQSIALRPRAGDDAQAVRWIPITSQLTLYASHEKMIQNAVIKGNLTNLPTLSPEGKAVLEEFLRRDTARD